MDLIAKSFLKCRVFTLKSQAFLEVYKEGIKDALIKETPKDKEEAKEKPFSSDRLNEMLSKRALSTEKASFGFKTPKGKVWYKLVMVKVEQSKSNNAIFSH